MLYGTSRLDSNPQRTQVTLEMLCPFPFRQICALLSRVPVTHRPRFVQINATLSVLRNLLNFDISSELPDVLKQNDNISYQKKPRGDFFSEKRTSGNSEYVDLVGVEDTSGIIKCSGGDFDKLHFSLSFFFFFLKKILQKLTFCGR